MQIPPLQPSNSGGKHDDELKSLIEVWKVSVDLHKFHDSLKQERAKRFTTVQIALTAAFGISIRDLGTGSVHNGVLFAPEIFSLSSSLAGLIYASIMQRLDSRAGDFVKVAKNQIQHVENRMKPHFNLKYLPYQGQNRVLNERSSNLAASGEYDDDVIPAKVSAKRFPLENCKIIKRFEAALGSRTAHSNEQLILLLIKMGWAGAFSAVLTTIAMNSLR